MNNYKYYSSLTISYKTGYIHSAIINGTEVVRVQVDQYAYAIQVKSHHAAKVIITKHVKRMGL